MTPTNICPNNSLLVHSQNISLKAFVEKIILHSPLPFLSCLLLVKTLHRHSRINSSSSGIHTCFVHTQHSYFQVTTLLPVSKKCDSLHVSTLLDRGLTNVTVPCPWEEDCTPYTSLAFWDFAILSQLHIYLFLIISISANKFYPQEYKYTECNRKVFYFLFNCTVSFVFCSLVKIKVCVLRGSDMKVGVFDSSTWVWSARKITLHKYTLLDRVSVEYWTHIV